MKTFAFTASALAALMAGQVLAQGQTTPRPGAPAAQPVQRPGTTQPTTGQAGQNQNAQSNQNSNLQLQQHTAACLLIGNQEEIALSEFGIDRAESDEVKEFAREMVKEHTKFISKLRKFTPQQASFELNVKADEEAVVNGNTGSAQKKAESAVRGGEATAPSAAKSTAAASITAAGSPLDQLLTMKRDKAHECLSINKKTLQEHQGEKFDQAFLGTQVAAHVSMLAELRSIKGKVSGEFGELVSEGEKSTEEHLEHAKELMEKLASSSGETQCEPQERQRRPGTDRPRTGAERGERETNSAPPAGDRPASPPGAGRRPSREG